MPVATPLPPPPPILLWTNQLRNKPCEPITNFDHNLTKLFFDLRSTMVNSNAIGLAAPQIGVFFQVAIVGWEQPIEPLLLVNPVIDEINSKGEAGAQEECLSIPQAKKINVKVRRCTHLEYSYQNIKGEKLNAVADGFLARVIQHEIDHLSGIFYVDRLGDLSRSLVMDSYRKYMRNNLVKSSRSLGASV